MFKETNEQKIARAEIKEAINGLLQACRNTHTAFYGFVWGMNPPILIRFGNVTETGPELKSLSMKLEDLVQERQDEGSVINDPLKEAN